MPAKPSSDRTTVNREAATKSLLGNAPKATGAKSNPKPALAKNSNTKNSNTKNSSTGTSRTGTSNAGKSSTKPTSLVLAKYAAADFAAAAECLKTLAHPVRLRIVQMLLHGRYTVGELASDCQTPDNVASDHLRLLQRCGFLNSQRDGRKVYYQVAEPHLKQLMACIEGRFLSGDRTGQ